MSFSPGDVVLLRLSQFAGGQPKLRPALVLSSLPGPYQTQLICGISTQLQQQVPNWDELIQPGDADFASSGLHRASVIRLSYLHATDPAEFAGAIGQIDAVRLDRLLARLAGHLHT
jgi:mRNA interferase MazF